MYNVFPSLHVTVRVTPRSRLNFSFIIRRSALSKANVGSEYAACVVLVKFN